VRGNLLEKGEIAEPVPNEVRNLAPSLLRPCLATSPAMTILIAGFGYYFVPSPGNYGHNC